MTAEYEAWWYPGVCGAWHVHHRATRTHVAVFTTMGQTRAQAYLAARQWIRKQGS